MQDCVGDIVLLYSTCLRLIVDSNVDDVRSVTAVSLQSAPVHPSTPAVPGGPILCLKGFDIDVKLD